MKKEYHKPVFAKADEAGSETIADKIAREKKELTDAPAKQESAEPAVAEKTAPTEEVDDEFEAALNEPDVSTDEDVQRAIADDDQNTALAAAFSNDSARRRSIEAAKLLRLIALDFQANTPDEHGVFGRGPHRFTLGDLRDLVGLPRAR